MTKLRSALVGGLLVLVAAVWIARLDTAPPELYVEMAERAPAGETLDLLISASEPVTYYVTYGELEVEHVTQDLNLSLIVQEGVHSVDIRAVDGAGNETGWQGSLTGVTPLVPRLEVAEGVLAGDPLTVRLQWEPAGAPVSDVQLAIPTDRLHMVEDEGSLLAIAAVPVGSEDATWTVTGSLVDEFGRVLQVSSDVRISGSTDPVQELNMTSAMLSVISDEGRELEARTLDEAYAQAVEERLWSEPFLLPMEGRFTSSFALARRYAAGGPVSYHVGTDIAQPTGTPIHATNDGIVRIADFFPIKGGLVLIDHGMGVSSLYLHQSRILVEAGQRIGRGEVIGEVGSTGLSTGPHLHWEMRVVGEPTNPMAWVDRELP